MQSGAIKLTIESRIENVELAGVSISRICREAGLSEQAAFEVEVCVVEAVNNAIKHAYGGNPEKEVEIYLELTPAALTVRVVDTGSPMPAKMFRPRQPQIRAGVDPPASGRGLFIIHSLMDQVSYATEGGRNVLSLTKSLGEPEPCTSQKKD
jgi:serine/threonine-protein kinase RsbW